MTLATTMDKRVEAANAMPRSEALIDASGIVKIYPTVSGEPVVALERLDMSVREGEIGRAHV